MEKKEYIKKKMKEKGNLKSERSLAWKSERLFHVYFSRPLPPRLA